MDWKIFFSSFALIFLMELGDKTQLTVLSISAGNDSHGSVLLGAVIALVLSTVLAVLAGSVLQRFVPPHYVHAVAAAIFILFGILLANTAYKGFTGAVPAVVPARPAEIGRKGILTRFVLAEAAVFEKAVLNNIRKLIEQTEDSSLRTILTELASEEQTHIEHLKNLETHAEHPIPREAFESLSPEAVRKGTELIDAILDQERSIEKFYSGLAQATHIPAMRRVLAVMADDEREHIRRWEELKEI